MSNSFLLSVQHFKPIFLKKFILSLNKFSWYRK
jgi:hypothetical protein